MNNEIQVDISGCDPLYVTFVDNTQIRDFPTRVWEFGFGDGAIYGFTQEEREEFAEFLSSGGKAEAGDENYNRKRFTYRHPDGSVTTSSLRDLVEVFQIPGDKLFLKSMPNSNKWLESMKEQFASTDIMVPVYGDDFATYPEGADRYGESHKEGGWYHVNEYRIISSKGTGSYGKVESIKYEDNEETDDTNFKNVVSAAWRPVNGQIKNSCQYDGNQISPIRGNVCGHMYKGPGLYVATMKQMPDSEVGYYGQKLSKTNFYGIGTEYDYKTIYVAPKCPCISTNVYEKYELDASGNPRLDEHGQKIYKKVNGKLMHAALSSTEYTADNPNYYGENDEYINFNPPIFDMYNGKTNRIFHGTSGYAPYVMSTFTTTVQPRSFPISGVDTYNGDWFTDVTEEEKGVGCDEYVSGWPVWQWNDSRWDSAISAIRYNTTHTYIMPGIYKASARVKYDMKRVPKDFYETIDEYCENSDTCEYFVLVKELMPRSPSISASVVGHEMDKTTVKMEFDVVPGSFPICDVVWDFGDGTEPLTLTRNVDDGYVEKKIIGDRTTAEYIGDGDPFDFSKVSATPNYGKLDISATDYQHGAYPEYDPRDWVITHDFIRSAVTDDWFHTVSAMAYVCNTNSMVFATYCTSGLSGMPAFDEVEGSLRLIDMRIASEANDIILTVEGDNGTNTNLYNMEWEGK